MKCYRRRDVLALLQLPRSTFDTLKRRGALPFLQELRPRIGREPRYRADLVDAYLSGEFQQSPFARHLRRAR